MESTILDHCGHWAEKSVWTTTESWRKHTAWTVKCKQMDSCKRWLKPLITWSSMNIEQWRISTLKHNSGQTSKMNTWHSNYEHTLFTKDFLIEGWGHLFLWAFAVLEPAQKPKEKRPSTFTIYWIQSIFF